MGSSVQIGLRALCVVCGGLERGCLPGFEGILLLWWPVGDSCVQIKDVGTNICKEFNQVTLDNSPISWYVESEPLTLDKEMSR